MEGRRYDIIKRRLGASDVKTSPLDAKVASAQD